MLCSTHVVPARAGGATEAPVAAGGAGRVLVGGDAGVSLVGAPPPHADSMQRARSTLGARFVGRRISIVMTRRRYPEVACQSKVAG
jgi:hypothetical protein